MHNPGIYRTLLLLLRVCSNYTPSGISPGKIPSHPSHLGVLIAADLQVRTRANVPLKDGERERDGTARGGGRGLRGREMFCPSGLGQPQRQASS